MMLIFSKWPAGWSRQSRCTLAIVVGAALLMLLMCCIDVPLAYMPEPIAENAAQFAEGARITVYLTLVSGLAGLVRGVLGALGRVSRIPPLRVQVLFVFLALPELMPWLKMDDFTSACVALAFNAGAYNAESIRAGLLAVPRGQTEAARSLGLSNWYTFRDVVFPQAFKIALPPLVNNFIALLKDSSLAYAIGVVELTNVANRIQSATFQPIPPLVTAAVIYLLLTTVLTQISTAVEHRMDVEGRQQ